MAESNNIKKHQLKSIAKGDDGYMYVGPKGKEEKFEKVKGKTKAWKLFRQYEDGSISSLYSNKKLKYEEGEWYEAEEHPDKAGGRKFRPMFHATASNRLPHLEKSKKEPIVPRGKQKGRVYLQVELDGAGIRRVSESQGGDWYIGQRMKIIKPNDLQIPEGGLSNVHENAIQPPVSQVNPSTSREYRKRGAMSFHDYEALVQGESSKTYDQVTEDWYLTHRSDRFHVKPRNWLMRTAGKAFTPLDYVSNPEILVTDEEEQFHLEEFTKYSEGYLTRWENVNQMTYPKEAFEMMQTEAFKEWWYHNPDGLKVPIGPSVITEADGSGWPEVILHGTLATISREEGFKLVHLKETDKFGRQDKDGLSTSEQEIGAHFGSAGHAIDILYGKKGGYANLDLKKDKGVLPARQQFAEAIKNQTPFAPTVKWYPGFIKMNNPLIIREDLYNWEFDVLMKHLASPESSGPSGTTSLLAQKGYTYSMDPTEYPDTENPISYTMGSGSALERILTYAVELADKEGKEIRVADFKVADDKGYDKKTGEDVTLVHQADVEYYRLKGFMRFLQDDLGYDGIKYWNQVEDKGAPDWSYIIFNPNQFKSIYNKGTFKWGKRGEPHRDFMTNTKQNKYRKVA